MDLAALAFSIDSSDTLKAVQALEALRQTTLATTQSNQDFTNQGDFLVTSMSNQGAGAARLSRQLADVGKGFQDLMAQADAARRAFDGTTASFDQWDIAQNKVEALGRAYGTTARGLDAYLQTANQLQMSSTQAAASVQRLTSALENQGAAAANIRAILSNNGVSINDLQTDQIDTLLTRIKSAFQRQPDTQQRTNDLRSVLGTFDPDVLGTFTKPNYVPIEQKKDVQIRSATDLDIARHSSAVRAAQRNLNENDTEYQDLSNNVGGGGVLQRGMFGGFQGRGGVSAVSDDDVRALRESADPSSAFARDGLNSQSGRLAFYKQAQETQLTQEMLDNPDKMTPEQRAASHVQAKPQFLPTSITEAWDYLNSGKVSDNSREINERDEQERQDGVGALRRWWNRSTRSDQNLFGTYTRTIKPGPQPTALDQEGTGVALAGFGDSRIQSYQSALGLEKSLGIYQGNTGGDTLEAAVGKDGNGGRRGAALASFVGAYGKQDGEQNFKAAQNRAVDGAQRAYLGDGAVQTAKVSLGLSNMSLGDSAQAKGFIAYAQERGVPASSLAGQSLSDLMDPTKSAGGALPAGLLDTYKQQYAIASRAMSNEGDRDQAHSMDNLTAQAGIAGSGSANLQDLIKYTDAYDASMKRVNDTTLATKAGNDAIARSEAERSVQMQKTIGDLEAANAAAEKYNAAMDPNATGSSVPRAAGADRTAAGIAADIQTQVDEMRRANPGGDPAALTKFTTDKQTEQGNLAVKSSQDKVALAEQELQTQNKLLSVAGQRQGIQDKMSRDIQVEATFEKELAEAMVSAANGDTSRLDQVQAAIEQMKRLKDAVAAVNLEAKAFKIGQDATNEINELLLKMRTPVSERGLLDAQRPTRDLARQSQDATTAGGGGGAIAATDMSATQQAFLRTVAGPESRGGDYHLRYTPDGGTHFDDLSQHPRVAEPIKGSSDTSTAAGAYQITGTTWNGLQRQYGYTDYQPATQDHAGWNLARDVYKQNNGGDLEADLQDPNKHAGIAKALKSTWPTMNPDTFGSKFNQNLHAQPGSTGIPNQAQADTALNDAAGQERRLYSLRGQAGIQEITEEQSRKQRADDAARPYLRSGDQVGAKRATDSIPNETDALGADHAKADAQAKLADQERDYQRQLTATKAATDITIQSNKDMAVAYGTSTEAVQNLQDKLKVEAEARTTKMSDLDKLNRLTDLSTQRITEQSAATERAAKSMRESTADQASMNDLGPLASEQQIGRRQAQLDIDRHNRDNPGEGNKAANDDYARDRDAQQAVKEQTDAVNDYRQAWQSAESAAFSAMNSVITGGGKASDVIKSLASSLANIGLNTIEKGLGNYGTGLLGGLFNGSTGAATSAGASAFDAAGIVASAQGNAWVGGQRVRAFASGGLIDRPTNFYSAGGETNLAGEMGTEAIMPLKRMPNGDLGVSTGAGGSKGTSIAINAPITVNGGTSNGAGMDSKSVAMMQSQLQEAVRQAVVAGIANEKRAGGALY